jgi:hypothetical protein
MSARTLTLGGVLSLAMLVSTSFPASAGSDTTPPELVSISITPTIAGNTTSQVITVTAVITDDLSGVYEDTQVQLHSPSGNEQPYAFFEPVGGDTYIASLTIPAYSEEGIWKDWGIWLIDNYDNELLLEYDDLLDRGLDLAVGVGGFSATYPRSLSLKVTNSRAFGEVDAALESTCFWWVPVSLQRKTPSGWKKVGSTLAEYDGDFSFFITKKGTYRAIAPAVGIGTAVLTTCLKASVRSQ